MISLLFPFRDDGSRSAQFEWLQTRWKHFMPDAEIIVAEDDGGTPFSKTVAVNNAYRRATRDVMAIVDADVWVNPKVIRSSVEAIRGRRHSWVRPCNKVLRLNKKFTENLIQGDHTKHLPSIDPEVDCDRVTPVVGLICIFSRDLFESVGGMDPRFRGWGWEDNSFNQLMDFKARKCLFLKHPVYHLWHPRAYVDGKPSWEGQTERNNLVGDDYKKAYKNNLETVKLIEKVKGLTGI